MKTLFKVFFGILAVFFSVIYIVALPVIMFTYPITRYISDDNNINNVLDTINIEEQVLTVLTPSLIEEQLGAGTETETPEESSDITQEEMIDLYTSPKLVSTIAEERQNLIEDFYYAIDNNVALEYSVPAETVDQLYTDILTNYIDESAELLPECTDEQVAEMTEEFDILQATCLPPDVDTDGLLSMLLESEDSEESTFSGEELPELNINQSITSKVHLGFRVAKYMIWLPVVLALLVLLFAPSKKTALTFLGLYNLFIGIIGALIWFMSERVISKIILSLPFEITGIENLDLEDSIMELVNEAATTAMSKMSTTGLIISFIVGIIGLIFLVIILILPAKNEQTDTTGQGEVPGKTKGNPVSKL